MRKSNAIVMVRNKDGVTAATLQNVVLYGPLAVHPEIIEWNTAENVPVLRSTFPAGRKWNWTITHAESGCIAATASRKKLACSIAAKLADAINWTGIRETDKARIESIRPTRNAIIAEVERKG